MKSLRFLGQQSEAIAFCIWGVEYVAPLLRNIGQQGLPR